MSAPRLDVLNGDLSGRSYRLEEREFVIGRGRSCDLVIPKRYISREHAKIIKNDAGFVIGALSRKNPVVVADRPIQKHVLEDGDEFELCGIRFRFRQAGPGQKAAPPPQDLGSGSTMGWEGDTEDGFMLNQGELVRSRTADRKSRDERKGKDKRRSSKRRSWDEDSEPPPRRTQREALARAKETEPSDAHGRGRGADDSWESAPKDDGWQSAPKDDGWESAPKGDDGWQSLPEDEISKDDDDGWQSAPKGDDGWKSAPPDDSWGEEERGGRGGARAPSDSWETEGRKRERERLSESGPVQAGGWESDEAPPRRQASGVVFDVEDDVDDREQTGALSAKKLSHLSSKGSGSGFHGESDGERTAELGKAVDPDDPDYDPFAEIDSEKPKERKTDPAREKALKIMSIIGIFGIVLAFMFLQQIKKEVPPTVSKEDEVVRVRVGQAKLFTIGWRTTNRPNTTARARLDGEPQEWDFLNPNDPIAKIEWMLPILEGRSLFLVRGLAEGETTFQIFFPESNRIKIYTVAVEGVDPHAEARDRRKAEFAKKPVRELDRIARGAFQAGKRYRDDRELPHKEGYYRQAALRFQEAFDAAEALAAKEGSGGRVSARTRTLLNQCEDMEQKSATDWEEYVRRQFERYKAMTRANDAIPERTVQLKKVLRAIDHSCDERFIRLNIVLKEWHRETLKGARKCEHDKSD